MTAEQFTLWLHGYLEISGAKTLEERELQVIKDHLEKFFIKVTPVEPVIPEGPLKREGAFNPCTCNKSCKLPNIDCSIHGRNPSQVLC